MVRPTVGELKAAAFTLSKILGTYKVKLSTQQCLDVLSQLTANVPYEALLSRADVGARRSPPARFLSHWLDIAESFCQLLSRLDRRAVDGAAYPGSKLNDGLHYHGQVYLLAAGAAVEAFARSASEFLHAQRDSIPDSLTFSVEHSDPIPRGSLGTLRVQCKHEKSSGAQLGPINWTRQSEDLLFGAEARIEIATWFDPKQPVDAPHVLIPRVIVTYEVCSQATLKVFAGILRKPVLADLWKSMTPMTVDTEILLTRKDDQDVLEEDWSTRDENATLRLAEFCERASKLSDDETCDQPPVLRLVRCLDRSNDEADLLGAFGAACVHAALLRSDSGGWEELFESMRPGSS